MEPGFLNKQPKRMRPDTDWCLPNMPEGSIRSFSSYAETDRSRLSCTPICYHKQKGRDLLQNKVDSDFLENNLVCLAQYRSKYTNRTTVDQRNSKFTKQEYTFLQMWPVLCGYFLTACFSCCNQGRPHSFSTGPHQVCRFSFCPVEMFTISCSSHLNGWIIWLLMTPVILFTPSFQLACWWPRGTWYHPDPSVALPLSALTLLSELEELASISPWLLGAE